MCLGRYRVCNLSGLEGLEGHVEEEQLAGNTGVFRSALRATEGAIAAHSFLESLFRASCSEESYLSRDTRIRALDPGTTWDQ